MYLESTSSSPSIWPSAHLSAGPQPYTSLLPSGLVSPACPPPQSSAIFPKHKSRQGPLLSRPFNASPSFSDEVLIAADFSSLNFCPQPQHRSHHFVLTGPTFFWVLKNAGLSLTPKPLYRLFLPSRTLFPVPSHPASFHSYPFSGCSLNPHFLSSAPTLLCVPTRY